MYFNKCEERIIILACLCLWGNHLCWAPGPSSPARGVNFSLLTGESVWAGNHPLLCSYLEATVSVSSSQWYASRTIAETLCVDDLGIHLWVSITRRILNPNYASSPPLLFWFCFVEGNIDHMSEGIAVYLGIYIDTHWNN